MNGQGYFDTIVDEDGWNGLLENPAGFADICFRSVLETGPSVHNGTNMHASLLLTDDTAMTDLNTRFRGRNVPTNVLAFPAGKIPFSENGSVFLGDIVLALGTCVREAGDKRISCRDHAAHLVIHGILHLSGYDHEHDADAEAMECRERKALEYLGIADPYAFFSCGRKDRV